MSFLDLVAADPDAPAVDDLTRRRTRGELLDRARRLGHWMLDDGGVPVGGHVAMLMGNRVEFLDVLVAAQHAGTWVTAVNWHLTAPEVAYILDDSAPTILFTDPEHEAVARAAAVQAEHAVDVVVAGPGLRGAGRPPRRRARSRSTGPAAARCSTPPAPPAGRRASSGGGSRASGDPRARRRGRDRARARRPGPHLVTGPLYHAAPLGFAAIDLANGSELVVMPRWDEDQCLRLIEERGVRNSHVVPTMCVRLLRLPEEERAAFDPSSLAPCCTAPRRSRRPPSTR